MIYVLFLKKGVIIFKTKENKVLPKALYNTRDEYRMGRLNLEVQRGTAPLVKSEEIADLVQLCGPMCPTVCYSTFTSTEF